METKERNKEFLYHTYLTAGLGSKDIGFYCGQIGGTNAERLERFGPRVIQYYYALRAESNHPPNCMPVDQAFGQSILAGFIIFTENKNKALVVKSDFIISDVYDFIGVLKTGYRTPILWIRTDCFLL